MQAVFGINQLRQIQFDSAAPRAAADTLLRAARRDPAAARLLLEAAIAKL